MVALTKDLEQSAKERKATKIKETVTSQAAETEIDHFRQTIKELEQQLLTEKINLKTSNQELSELQQKQDVLIQQLIESQNNQSLLEDKLNKFSLRYKEMREERDNFELAFDSSEAKFNNAKTVWENEKYELENKIEELTEQVGNQLDTSQNLGKDSVKNARNSLAQNDQSLQMLENSQYRVSFRENEGVSDGGSNFQPMNRGSLVYNDLDISRNLDAPYTPYKNVNVEDIDDHKSLNSNEDTTHLPNQFEFASPRNQSSSVVKPSDPRSFLGEIQSVKME